MLGGWMDVSWIAGSDSDVIAMHRGDDGDDKGRQAVAGCASPAAGQYFVDFLVIFKSKQACRGHGTAY